MNQIRYLPKAVADKPVRWKPLTSQSASVHLFDAETIDALNAALAANRPLLVRGEPGIGKSQLARAAAEELGRAFIAFTVDIRTEALDLLWHFDAIQRLAEAQVAGALLAKPAETLQHAVKLQRDELRADLAVEKFIRPGPLWWAFDWESAEGQTRKCGGQRSPVENGENHGNGCVLLIDEIDKADADVPNGLLEALGTGRFTPLAHSEPVVAREPLPLVIITTNEERALPDAFIRRCLVLNLTLPKIKEEFVALMIKRGGEHFADLDESLRREAAEQLFTDREACREKALRPLPGQAEYLDLLRVLRNLADHDTDDLPTLLERMRKFALSKHPEAP